MSWFIVQALFIFVLVTWLLEFCACLGFATFFLPYTINHTPYTKQLDL